MHSITQEQIDNVKLPQESDKVKLDWESFSGKVSYYVLEGKELVLQVLSFRAKKSEALSDFLYTKPSGDDVLNPSEIQEKQPRSEYYPLRIVNDAYKWPNHWHRKDNALFCAVKKDWEWETRYFPKKNIPDQTWEEAKRIIAE